MPQSVCEAWIEIRLTNWLEWEEGQSTEEKKWNEKGKGTWHFFGVLERIFV